MASFFAELPARWDNRTFHVLPDWIWVCLPGQLPQFARVRQYSFLCLLVTLSKRLLFSFCLPTRNRQCIVSLKKVHDQSMQELFSSLFPVQLGFADTGLADHVAGLQSSATSQISLMCAPLLLTTSNYFSLFLTASPFFHYFALLFTTLLTAVHYL